MTVLSKSVVDEIVYHKCSEIFHPREKNCSGMALHTAVEILKKASLLFFGPIYLAHLCLHRKKISKSYLMEHFISFLRTCLFGAAYGAIFTSSHCLLRKILGKYTYYTVAFIPGLLCGLTVCIEPGWRRSINAITIFNLVLECIWRSMQYHWNVKRSTPIETCLFMLTSGFLMYLLRKNSSIVRKTFLMWFFTPLPVKKVEDDQETQNVASNEIKTSTIHLDCHICPHNGSCREDIFKSFGKFFAIGLGLQLLRRILPLHRRSQPLQKNIFRDKKTVLLAFFLGGYVGIYKTVACLLNQYQGKDSELHAIVAGLIAGSAYCIQPNITLLITALSTVLQILAQKMTSDGIIPDHSLMTTLVFALCNGCLVHSVIYQYDLTPKFFTSLVNITTGETADNIVRAVFAVISRELPHGLKR